MANIEKGLSFQPDMNPWFITYKLLNFGQVISCLEPQLPYL